jgi:hypothetical protein
VPGDRLAADHRLDHSRQGEPQDQRQVISQVIDPASSKARPSLSSRCIGGLLPRWLWLTLPASGHPEPR